jgi:hypothetical protein
MILTGLVQIGLALAGVALGVGLGLLALTGVFAVASGRRSQPSPPTPLREGEGRPHLSPGP